jgi:hypothetical protein
MLSVKSYCNLKQRSSNNDIIVGQRREKQGEAKENK